MEALEGRKFLPCVFLLSLSLVSAASAEATATEQSEFAEMKTFMKSTEVNWYKEKQSCMKDA